MVFGNQYSKYIGVSLRRAANACPGCPNWLCEPSDQSVILFVSFDFDCPTRDAESACQKDGACWIGMNACC